MYHQVFLVLKDHLITDLYSVINLLTLEGMGETALYKSSMDVQELMFFMILAKC
jgi:hypothetical protein